MTLPGKTVKKIGRELHTAPIMTDIDTRPEFTDTDVLQYLDELFGIAKAVIKPLPSYVDQNFYVSTPQGEEYVFKISNMQEDKGIAHIWCT